MAVALLNRGSITTVLLGRVNVIRVHNALVAVLIAGGIAAAPASAVAGDHGRHRGHHKADRVVVVREWRNYDYDRLEPGYRYYDPARYYVRDDRAYRVRRLGPGDRIYRGLDNRYYCRRGDGTTGLIVGGVAGGVLGNIIAPGESKALGTLIGAGGGALLGRTIDRNHVSCR
jgi:Glycine zipper 2TM domain